MAGEDVAKIGTVEDVFQRRENANVDGRTICAVNKSREKQVVSSDSILFPCFWKRVYARVNVPAGEE